MATIHRKRGADEDSALHPFAQTPAKRGEGCFEANDAFGLKPDMGEFVVDKLIADPT